MIAELIANACERRIVFITADRGSSSRNSVLTTRGERVGCRVTTMRSVKYSAFVTFKTVFDMPTCVRS